MVFHSAEFKIQLLLILLASPEHLAYGLAFACALQVQSRTIHKFSVWQSILYCQQINRVRGSGK